MSSTLKDAEELLLSGGGGPCRGTNGVFRCSQCDGRLSSISHRNIPSDHGLCAGGWCYDSTLLKDWARSGPQSTNKIPHGAKGFVSLSQINHAMDGKDYCDEGQTPTEEGKVLGPPLSRDREKGPRRRGGGQRHEPRRDDGEWDFNIIPHLVFFIFVAMFLDWLRVLDIFPPSPSMGGKTPRSTSEIQEQVLAEIEKLSDAKTFNKILAAAVFVVPASDQEAFELFLSYIRRKPEEFKRRFSNNRRLMEEALQASLRRLAVGWQNVEKERNSWPAPQRSGG